MKIFTKVADIRQWRGRIHRSKSVGLVPTMGALHAGHGSLIRRSLRENDFTVVSIFVNPTQFGPKEDFKHYPRPWREDKRLLAQLGVQVLFCPGPAQMYQTNHKTSITVSDLGKVLCGSPGLRGAGHFKGVATVVAKLFNLIHPTQAYFGMKDFQQLRVIEQMVADLNMGVRIVRCQTVRERDGLAMSSRNQYLTPGERKRAVGLFQALRYGQTLLKSHKKMKFKAVQDRVRRRLKALVGVTVEYVELVDPETLTSPRRQVRPLLLAAAVRFPSARLIDNVWIT